MAACFECDTAQKAQADRGDKIPLWETFRPLRVTYRTKCEKGRKIFKERCVL